MLLADLGFWVSIQNFAIMQNDGCLRNSRNDLSFLVLLLPDIHSRALYKIITVVAKKLWHLDKEYHSQHVPRVSNSKLESTILTGA